MVDGGFPLKGNILNFQGDTGSDLGGGGGGG